VIPVPDTGPVIEGWRRRLDPEGYPLAPAHITLLYPFLDPDLIDDAVIAELGELLGRTTKFDYDLDHLDWFDDRVLYVAPEPAERFTGLTADLVRRWPGCLPYGGTFSRVVPHLTVGKTPCEIPLEEAAADIAPELPIHTRAEEVWLMTAELPAGWSVIAKFPLADQTGVDVPPR